MQQRANVSAYRDELKGIAILWVVFFHAILGLQGILYDVQRIGYGGVDMFFFLSGFGLYHSLERSGDLGGYCKRRAWRLLPAYLPVALLWSITMVPMFGLGMAQSVRTAMGTLTMMGFWAGVPHILNWYVSALLASLALAPFLHALIRKAKKPWLMVVSLLLISFAIGLCFIGDDRYMAVSRLPVFILGMAFALPTQKKERKAMTLTAYALALVAGLCVLFLCLNRYPELLNDFGMYWHPFVLIAPALCVLLATLFSLMKRWTRFFAPLRYLGKASFEIFLLASWAEVLGKRGWASTPLEWALISIAAVLLGCGYHALVDFCMRKRRMNA